MKYIEPFTELFTICIQKEKDWYINLFQGNGFVQSFGGLVDYFRDNEPTETQMYLDILSLFIEKIDFQDYIINLKKEIICEENKALRIKIKNGVEDFSRIKLASNEKLLEIIDWELIKINMYKCISSYIPHIISDWKILLLDDIYKNYKKKNNDIFAYSVKNNLSEFYLMKGLDLKMEDNYGLFPVSDDFLLKANGLPKIYDPKNDTHIIIRFVPNDFVQYLSDLRSQCRFTLAFRPDYDLIGPNIKDIYLILEGVIQGNIFETCISQLPSLSELIDYFAQGDRLIISKEGNNLTFEELADDINIYEETIITQVVHLQYEVCSDKEYIKHIDHEFVFYDIESYEKKQDDTRIKGDARKRFKTFKIDNANIEFTSDANSNILFQTLKAFFYNDLLINEYFERLIYKKLK
jgi:hypothetical protein